MTCSTALPFGLPGSQPYWSNYWALRLHFRHLFLMASESWTENHLWVWWDCAEKQVGAPWRASRAVRGSHLLVHQQQICLRGPVTIGIDGKISFQHRRLDFSGIKLGLVYTLKYILPRKGCALLCLDSAHNILGLLERSSAWVMCYNRISIRFEINGFS